ncbi:MAG TPA: hypothetical protein VK652_13525 [Steroidobacteraceae bacterium]|nr:hypothetical protein [Steroidobacteraceae bacterium]
MPTIPAPISHTVDAIYAWHESRRNAFEGDGISVSELGHECHRYLWYKFRWAFTEPPKQGRMLRLFETGDREELRMLEELRAIGCKVSGEQERVTACQGHVRGKIDGKVVGIPEAPVTQHVVETKTHKAESWRAVVKHGVQKSKPAHYVQMQIYMHLLDLPRALYMAHNKDTDELHIQRIEHDTVFCMQLLAGAERIIAAHSPPSKLHENPESKAAFHCTYCPAKALCHEGAMPRRNCRTCISSTPVDGGWQCELHKRQLNRAVQKAGCWDHLFLPGLVPGKQIDADPVARTITYEMADGSEWVDGGGQ